MFREGLIYKLICNKTGNFYIGSTEDYQRRKRQHKSKTSTCSSRNIIKHNDYRWEIIQDNIEFLFTNDLEWYEAQNIRQYFDDPLCVNQVIPLRTMQEWVLDNRDKSNQIKRKWASRNKQTISKKRSVKVMCECGCMVSKMNISTHRKSNKHKDNLEKMLSLV
jgi:hypothetical protein